MIKQPTDEGQLKTESCEQLPFYYWASDPPFFAFTLVQRCLFVSTHVF